MRYRELLEGHWGWDDDRYDDEREESEDEQLEREERERAERREGYGDNDDSEFDYNKDYKLFELPTYEKMKAERDFYFEERNVYSLEGAPNEVENFVFERNHVTKLKFCPQTVERIFDCSYNGLTSLEGGPQGTVAIYKCVGNPILNFKGAPHQVHNFLIEAANLKSYEGAPKVITGICKVPLLVTNMREFVQHFPKLGVTLSLTVSQYGHGPMTNVLSLFATGLQKIECANPHVLSQDMKQGFEIMNQFLPRGKKGMMHCQTALLKAGLKDWAKL
jgi:hypothetical protein